jgi:hypothetical protein
MSSDVKVLIEKNGLSKTLNTSVIDNTPAEAGYVPLLNNDGRINNELLETTLDTAESLRWFDSGTARKISDGSDGLGPNDETISDIKDAQLKWVNGYPVLYGFKNGQTIGVRVDAARNSDKVAELDVHTGNNVDANKIVRTDSGGYIVSNTFRSLAAVDDNQTVGY